MTADETIYKAWQEYTFDNFMDLADGLSGKWICDSMEQLIEYATIDCRWALFGKIREGNS